MVLSVVSFVVHFRWFHRGESVLVEGNLSKYEREKFPATISAIGTDSMWVRKNGDNTKIRIYVSQLVKGRYTLKRRAS